MSDKDTVTERLARCEFISLDELREHVAKTKKEILEVRPENGQIWKAPLKERAVVQWITDDQWILLSEPLMACHGGSAMVAMTDKTGAVFMSKEQLTERLRREGWVLTDERLDAV